ncbi:MAG TPA: tRNA (adenosine(37)-N6)-threonylcarbamoyltransferase complex transferase subunit TsaD [Candidatus Omnitrophica bacterium]|nr:MAG: tRNA (adenosine(37)-N6)-threonylcarbamoyltransferase complex transferase subunit TsaD [Omnitrophica WOR_2 bacterium GWA2_63_20]OGX35564.1 MAG: tRNA (adenosine(37)-N6)-threonylcarbamoyltransferase complex transferase subunit TsaD [Omnitrophica WOR_2 bacterium RIFCSPHIGHO2_02_FULL_63_39]OGX46470.1 MAG: tRNA (adenosine(37)-N6)-threonylcarbamoyltransferase complex transferase subunit TsaD [Omnitrophica WOR_2 bacterium RIFCSPLOWO2_02_FULL_63_16]OGX48320.1 MAG: tRNA (adenosine(37)-N6)-threonyl
MVRILGIETSCDETAIGIVEDGRRVASSVVASSQEFHRPYGGVVPEIASRVHVEVIWGVCEEALARAQCQLAQIDAIAVTQGPGLPGALLIGLAFAKGLALSLDRPLIGVDHLAAHLYVGEMTGSDVEPPYVGLVVSGGHTLLCVVHPEQRVELLGETKDDAVGESFDKVAKMLGLGYPGGPAIDRLSEEGRRDAVAFTRSTARDGFDFSFSGLKTDVYRYVQKLGQGAGDKGQGKDHTPRPGPLAPGPQLDRQQIADIAASFQEAAVDILMAKALRACQRTGLRRLVVGGGVAANRRLRERLQHEQQAGTWQVVVPEPSLCVDNGAMVAGLAFASLRRGHRSPLNLNIYTNSQLN